MKCCFCWVMEIYSLEVRVKQYVPRNILNHTTSRYSKLLDSAICDHLNALNSCVVNYSDDCLVVFHRARTKQHRIVLEAIYILFNRSFLCKQNPKHFEFIRKYLILDLGWFWFFFSPPPFVLLTFFIFTSLLLNLIYIVLNNFWRLSLDESHMKVPLCFQ